KREVISALDPSQTAIQPAPASKFSRALTAGKTGQAVRVAIVHDDFGGYQQLIGRDLPGGTQVLDLASECDPNIQPANASQGEGAIGYGTQTAIAVAKAIPGARLTLLRIDRDAPYQLYAAAR